ncbi:YciI family protein [Micromonospora sp. NPDC048930]|uniref:YciI family protein n=1 Tax=Micromonospora sp. NPDC048930 TaxID=3364261 RepID=UPI00370F9DF9
MTRYLISFNDGAMDHIPDEEMPDVGKASHAVVQEAVNAGVWVFGAGLERQRASVVATDGMVTDGPYPETRDVIGGFSIVDVASREEALAWAAKIAVSCRCAQEVRELMPDPEQDAWLRDAGRWCHPSTTSE